MDGRNREIIRDTHSKHTSELLSLEEIKENYDQEDISIKIVIVGDSGVGKSNILSRYISDEFSKDSKATIGVELATKTYKMNDKIIKINLWDTAGQERYKSISSAYYKGAKGAVIVYDVTKKDTLDNVYNWYREIREMAGSDISIIILGNKSDLNLLRKVDNEETTELGEKLNVPIIEISAKTSEGLEESFHILISKIFSKNNNFKGGDTDKGNKTISKGHNIKLTYEQPFKSESGRKICCL